MQIVGYETGDPDPGLYLYDWESAPAVQSDDSAQRFVSLSTGTKLSFKLDERHCAGIQTESGRHRCMNSRGPYCHDHQSTWVCAKCTGTCLKDEMDCFDTHAIYLAGFAPDIIKVGVTKDWRLRDRLREQGADCGAQIRTVENGRIARQQEAAIATQYPDRVRVEQKIAGLGQFMNTHPWKEALANFDIPPADQFDFEYGFSVETKPVSETIATGRVIGVKGRILIIEHRNTTYAVDMRDLVGYEVRSGPLKRHLQSSLGAWN